MLGSYQHNRFSKLPFLRAIALWALCFLAQYSTVQADTTETVTGRYASIVVDADTLDIIHARKIDDLRYPASLTKVMTLLMTFDALEAGTLSLNTPLSVSHFAAKTQPSKLGVKAGQTITVENAIKALAVKSANDVAVVLAEHLGGSQEAFAQQMSAKAQELSMQRTVFKNPHGLPNKHQVTSARDMAKLANHILTRHKKYYTYFGIESFTYKGQTHKNTNRLLPWLDGVDGFKTGFTRASGYNLIISAKRDGRRIIAVVLGGATGASRNEHMQDLVERSFETIGVQQLASIVPKAKKTPKRKVVKESLKAKIKPKTAALRLRGRNAQPLTIVVGDDELKVANVALDQAWSIQLGAFSSEEAARSQLQAARRMLPASSSLSPDIVPLIQPNRQLYLARLSGLTFETAQAKCRILEHLKTGCIVISPSG